LLHNNDANFPTQNEGKFIGIAGKLLELG